MTNSADYFDDAIELIGKGFAALSHEGCYNIETYREVVRDLTSVMYEFIDVVVAPDLEKMESANEVGKSN